MMTRKICSFIELGDVVPPQFNKIDNKIIDDFEQLGNIENKYFFSFDEANHEVQADPATKFKIYDFNNAEDAAEFKEAANGLQYIAIKLDEIEKSLIASKSLYALIKAAVEGSEELVEKIQDVETKKEEFLQSLGIPGQSAI